jgi:hypothetical protein
MSYIPPKKKNSSDYKYYRGFYQCASGGISSTWMYFPTFWQRMRGLPARQEISAYFFVEDRFLSTRSDEAYKYIDQLWETKTAEQIAGGDFDPGPFKDTSEEEQCCADSKMKCNTLIKTA